MNKKPVVVDRWDGKPKSKVFTLLWFAKTYYRKSLIKLTIEYWALRKKYDDLSKRYDGLLQDLLKQTVNSPTLTKDEELILSMIASNESKKDMCSALGITYPTLAVRIKALEKKGLVEFDGRKLRLTNK